MKNKIIILLLMVVMIFCGCNIMLNNNESKLNRENLEHMGYVIYEEAEIIEVIREIYQGMIASSLTSHVEPMEIIKEKIPIENIREYSDGYIIEYPMENRIYVIVTDKGGRRRVSFMRAYEERTEKDISELKSGMSVDEVKKLFPEIEVPNLESEIVLNNNEIVGMSFEEKGGKKVLEAIESLEYPFGESEFDEIMNIEEGQLVSKNTLLVIDNVLINGEKQLEAFASIKGKEQAETTGDKEVLNIKYIDTVEGVKSYEYVLRYQNGKYILEDSQHETRQDFKYIVKLKGKSLITGNKENGYFLTNDKEATYEKVTHEILKSSSVESMDCRQLFLTN